MTDLAALNDGMTAAIRPHLDAWMTRHPQPAPLLFEPDWFYQRRLEAWTERYSAVKVALAAVWGAGYEAGAGGRRRA